MNVIVSEGVQFDDIISGLLCALMKKKNVASQPQPQPPELSCFFLYFC